jgi:hypothetical protein
MKGERPMFDVGVKETLCTRCVHQEVCIHKQDYLDILKAVENATVIRNTHDGKIASKNVIHYDFISEISVGCKYHQNRTETYRPREAIL